jgi:hypothetical protein
VQAARAFPSVIPPSASRSFPGARGRHRQQPVTENGNVCNQHGTPTRGVFPTYLTDAEISARVTAHYASPAGRRVLRVNAEAIRQIHAILARRAA